jgi:hypothetical protein
MRSYKKCKTKSQAQDKEWKTTKRNGRQQKGTEDNGIMERETDDRCSASISDNLASSDTAVPSTRGLIDPRRLASIDRLACFGCSLRPPGIYKQDEAQHLRSLRSSSQLSTLLSLYHNSSSPNATSSPMDFFFNLFGPTRSELELEVEQVPVDFEDNNNQTGACVVA